MRLQNFGILGTGMLGNAMMSAIAHSGCVEPDGLWALNTRGSDSELAALGVHVTDQLPDLVARCDTILFCVPPAHASSMRFDGAGKMVFSVMAGVTVSRLSDLAQGARVLRAMSSPAAQDGLAYSPWFASDQATPTDKATIRTLLGACGMEDEVAQETHIDHFTALTGPVPGFVAAFAEALQSYAEQAGIAPKIADRAVRQLMLASGHALSADARTASEHVQEMIDYAGTTAAGLKVLRAGPMRDAIGDALAAATARVRTIADD